MKLTEKQLKQIVREEVTQLVKRQRLIEAKSQEVFLNTEVMKAIELVAQKINAISGLSLEPEAVAEAIKGTFNDYFD